MTNLPPALVALVEPFAQMVAERVADTIARGAAAAPHLSTHEGFVTRKQAAALGIEGRVLRRAERSGELPCYRPGKTVVYRRADVLAFVERAKVAGESPTAPAEVAPLDPFACAVNRAEKRRRRATY